MDSVGPRLLFGTIKDSCPVYFNVVVHRLVPARHCINKAKLCFQTLSIYSSMHNFMLKEDYQARLPNIQTLPFCCTLTGADSC